MSDNNKQGKTRKPKRGRPRERKGMGLADRPCLEPNAGGIDIGAREIFVAVPPDRDECPVRAFDTFTEDLHAMARWLKACGVTTVAMESTGVYWIPLYDILEAHGIRPCLTNARHMKNVPGRRTDWHECQWLQFLHSVGLLRAAFRPEADVCAVRAIIRHRGELVQMAVQHVQHMQKALTQMNLQIQHAISDITGLTGLAIVDAISGWGAGCECAGQTARSSYPCQYRDDSEVAGGELAAGAFVYPLTVAPAVADLSAADRGMRSGDREVGAWLRAARGPSRAAVTAGPQAQPQRQEEEEEEWHSRTRIRSTNRGVQTIRRGHHADPRPSNNGLHFVQRSRPGHVEVAHLRALCFLAGAMPGQ